MKSLKKLTSFVCGVISGIFPMSAGAYSPVLTDMTLVLSNMRKILLQEANMVQLSENAKKWYTTILTDGSWTDINYQDQSRAPWSPQVHLNRILDMAYVYSEKSNLGSQNLNLQNAIVLGLNYWVESSPISKNWWYNEISVPKLIGKILVLLNGSNCLDNKLIEQLIQRMKKGNLKKQEGANKTDIALHFIFRAALTGDKILLKETIEEVYESVHKGNEEGIQFDESYHQHGNQLYISGYGEVFIEGVLSIMRYLDGTDYCLPKEKLTILSDFILNGFGVIFRSIYKDYNAGGRLISRKNALKYERFINQLKILSVLDIENEKRCLMLIQEITNPKSVDIVNEYNRMFWCSDYMVHNRQSYQASVRGTSKRCYKTETGGNGENLKGTLLSAGSFSIRILGDEYFNIFPCWDWTKIPGVTSLDKLPPYVNVWGEYGKTDFVGGVSNGMVGLFAIDYNEYEVKAHKGYFFFDNEIVCLGSGICGNGVNKLITTVDQCLFRDSLFCICNKKEYTLSNANMNNINSIYHNQIAYYFPDALKTNLKASASCGSWKEINSTESTDRINRNLLLLYIDHGRNSRNDKYTYLIVPGLKNENEFKSYPIENIEIIQNDISIQAVANKQSKILQIIFYNSGEFHYEGISISVDIPSVILIPDYNNPNSLYLSDPTQNNNSICLVYNKKQYIIELPEKTMKGSSLQIKLNE